MSDDTEGPLSKLMRGLGIKNDLAPIAAIKRIEERPVSLNPETMFKMAPAPDLMSDTGVHQLYGDELIRRSPTARAFDLDYEYASFRPEGDRWRCVDLNTFDGGPDAPGCFQGYGASEKEARLALLDLFADYDERPPPKPSRVIHSSQFEPPTYADQPKRDDFEDDINFDDGLSDADEPR